MSAPKEGLDYFPFSVDLLDDEPLDFLREKYGVVVNDIYISLLCLLYKRKGYYIPYATEKEKTDCVWFIYKRVRGGKYPVQQEAIPRVIEAIVAQGLFDRDHFNKIITSERAQRTYYSATVERKLESFNIIPEYWLLNEEIMRKLSKKHPYYLYLYPPTDPDETQSKSTETQSKSTDLPLNKIKRNITSNEVINIPPNACVCVDEVFTGKLKAFCDKWGIVIDTNSPLIAKLDFDKLNKAYTESATLLQDKDKAPYAHTLSWVVKNSVSILAGKFKDKVSVKAARNQKTSEMLKGIFNHYKAEEEGNDTY